MNPPNNTYTIEVGRTRIPYRKVIRSANHNSFSVALEFFGDAHPGEHYEGNTYRYMSTNWGWVWVTSRPTEEDDYANPEIS